MNIRDYFAFTRGERRGSLVLTSILLLTFLIRYIPVSENDEFIEDPSFNNAVMAFIKSQDSLSTVPSHSYFNFDPNTISEVQWRELGFKDWQIKSINKYKNKGGVWKTKQDVSKIYGLSQEHFNELEPYILLPEKIFTKKPKGPTYFKFNPNTTTQEQWKKLGFKQWQINNIEKFKSAGGKWETKEEFGNLYGLRKERFEQLKPFILLPDKKLIEKTEITLLNINTASAKELTTLPGVNSIKYANIIIKYRDQLGGFHSKEQLLEVWGMKKEQYQRFENQIIVNSNQVIKHNINTSNAAELVKHPHINWKVANAIEKYRKAHGDYQNIEELRSIHLIDEKLYQKIAPYLKLKE